MIKSRPTASASPQLVPNGPRTPITVPTCASCNARLTAPTARMVSMIVSSVAVGVIVPSVAVG